MKLFRLCRVCTLLLFICVSVSVWAKSDHISLSILNFKDLEVPKHYMERTPVARADLDPFTCAGVEKMLKAKIGAEALKQMAMSRGTICNPSPEELVRLKQAGAADDLLVYMSENTLAPNQSIDLVTRLTFRNYKGPDVGQDAFFHIKLNPKARVFYESASHLGGILGAKWKCENTVRYKDGPLDRAQREICAVWPIKTNKYGKIKVEVFVSKKPVRDAKPMGKPFEFTFEYPRFSRTSACFLEAEFDNNVALPGRWNLIDARLDCEWNG